MFRQSAEKRFLDIWQRLVDRLDLQRLPHAKKVQDGTHRQGGDDIPPPVMFFYEPVLSQTAQRLTDRSSTGSKARGNLLGPELLVRFELGPYDSLANISIGAILRTQIGTGFNCIHIECKS